MISELSQREKGLRVLTVLYSLSGGSTNVPVHKDSIFNECARLRIFQMSEHEFEAFRAKTVADAHVLDAEIVNA